eukprot:601803_1
MDGNHQMNMNGNHQMKMNDGMDMGSCGMTMYFHWDSSSDCVLFETWSINNTWNYMLTCVALFALCVLREFSIYVAKYYEMSTLSRKPIPFWPTKKRYEELWFMYSESQRDAKGKAAAVPLIARKSTDMYDRLVTFRLRFIDCFLYGASLTLGYALMLIVMTFNAGLIIVVVCGYCFGRLIFRRQVQLLQRFATIGQRLGFQELQDADHCHIHS